MEYFIFCIVLQTTLQRDIHSTKGDLNDTNDNISGTKDKLSQLETGTQDSINKVHVCTILRRNMQDNNYTPFTKLLNVWSHSLPELYVSSVK